MGGTGKTKSPEPDVSVSWRLGIDVGDRSVGLAAIAYDGEMPVELLAGVSVIHDGGAGSFNNKQKHSRKAIYGVQRRMRRARRRRRQRLARVDRLIEDAGFVIPAPIGASPSAPWDARRRLVADAVPDVEIRAALLGRAIHHIARHRGWRNPWTSLGAFETLDAPSSSFTDSVENLMTSDTAPSTRPRTLGELGALLTSLPGRRLSPSQHDASGRASLLLQRPRQEDLLFELRLIARTQGLSDELSDNLVEAIFDQAKPSVPLERVGHDPFLVNEPRALISSLEFQEFRVRQKIANLRFADNSGEIRSFDDDVREKAVDKLLAWRTAPPNWADVAFEVLGLDDESRLIAPDEDGLSGTAPVDRTTMAVTSLLEAKKKTMPVLREWWDAADRRAQSDLVCALVDATTATTFDGLDALPEDEILMMAEHLEVASGRAAYCRTTLARLNDRMRVDGVDEYEARLQEFGIPPEWHPPLPSLGDATGQPTVDRNIAVVRKFLSSAELRWGPPVRITVEIVRAGAQSPARVQEDAWRRKSGRDWNKRVRAELAASDIQNPRDADVWKHTFISLYDGRCLYCGCGLTWTSTELDHVVPRADAGSNRRANLAAVCTSCNAKKGRRPFGLYAKETGISLRDAIDRVKSLRFESGGPWSRQEFAAYKTELIRRLRRVSPDKEDIRKIEATSYAALAVRDRLQCYFQEKGIEERVRVYSGGVTAEARWVAQITTAEVLGRAELPNGLDRKRVDRRHHAVDAAVLTTLDQGAVMALAARRRGRVEREFSLGRSSGKLDDWKRQWLEGPGQAAGITHWINRAQVLKSLLKAASTRDAIAVVRPLRLRPRGPAHAETVKAFEHRQLGATWTPDSVARVVDTGTYESLRVLLGDSKALDADPERKLVHQDGRLLSAADQVTLYPGTLHPMVALRGGAADMVIVHHARIYAWHDDRGRIRYGMVRVFLADLAASGLLRRGVDVFTAELPRTSASWRVAKSDVTSHVESGRAQYLGWITVGDELEIPDPATLPTKGRVAEFTQVFAERRWVVAGFEQPTILAIRPSYVAGEGINEGTSLPPDARNVAGERGWRVAVNVLFGLPGLAVIRRTALGRPRWGNEHLPQSWYVATRVSELLE